MTDFSLPSDFETSLSRRLAAIKPDASLHRSRSAVGGLSQRGIASRVQHHGLRAACRTPNPQALTIMSRLSSTEVTNPALSRSGRATALIGAPSQHSNLPFNAPESTPPGRCGRHLGLLHFPRTSPYALA